MTFGTEDCLNVGVFTKSLEGRRPVLVWIHGGGFVIGNGELEPDMFMDQDLVNPTLANCMIIRLLK